MNHSRPILPLIVLAASIVAFAGPARAVDGVIEINQELALAGGITPGDAPGFPVSLTLPGSYRLTGNLDISAQPSAENLTAIEILSSFVTLDRNGFALLGPTISSGSPTSSCSPLGTGDGISSPR
jgi:hypothetical protein